MENLLREVLCNISVSRAIENSGHFSDGRVQLGFVTVIDQVAIWNVQ